MGRERREGGRKGEKRGAAGTADNRPQPAARTLPARSRGPVPALTPAAPRGARGGGAARPRSRSSAAPPPAGPGGTSAPAPSAGSARRLSRAAVPAGRRKPNPRGRRGAVLAIGEGKALALPRPQTKGRRAAPLPPRLRPSPPTAAACVSGRTIEIV